MRVFSVRVPGTGQLKPEDGPSGVDGIGREIVSQFTHLFFLSMGQAIKR
jgi:hypothetical protein